MNISPGLIGLYWLAASFGVTALWIGACHLARHAASAACPCGGAHQ